MKDGYEGIIISVCMLLFAFAAIAVSKLLL
jgi:hypothetical protein